MSGGGLVLGVRFKLNTSLEPGEQTVPRLFAQPMFQPGV